MIPLVLPVFPSLLHRWGTGMLYRLVLLLTIMTAVVVAIFAAPQWPSFDAMHPKRVCVLYMENTTSNSLDLHIAGLDNTITLFAQMVEDATDIMELSNRPQISHINDDIPDWDIVGNQAEGSVTSLTSASTDISRQPVLALLQDTSGFLTGCI